MELKKGYKLTAVGMIPEDWNVEPLGSFTSFISYGFTNPMPTVSNGIYMVTAKDINKGRIMLEYARQTSKLAYEQLLSSKSKPKKNDVLLTKDGTLGRLALVGNERICINQSVALLRPNNRISPQFFKFLLESSFYQNKMLEDAGGSTIKHIYITIVNRMLIAIPSEIEEQTAIANALSDADALIQSLTSLIVKKRQIKQGAMQTLLNPYKNGRLKPGWVVKEADEIAEVRSGKRLPLGNFLTHKETNHPYIRVTDMYYGGVRLNEIMYVPNDVYPSIKNYRIFKKDIFISVAGTLGIVGKIPCELDGANLTENANRFTNIQCDRDYLLFVLSSPLIQDVIDSEKTLGAQPKLALTRIRKFKIPLPTDKQEQTRIATILSDMDAEIAALEAKLAKYRHIKQGMMQNLLTGRIRLV